VRYRTAAVLFIVVIGGMFVLPIRVFAIFPDLKSGVSMSAPGYERILVGLVDFWGRFRWFLALLIVPALLTCAALTSESRAKVRQ